MLIVKHEDALYHVSTKKDLPGLVEQINVGGDPLETIISACTFMEINTNKTKVGVITPDQPLSDILSVKVTFVQTANEECDDESESS